MSAVGELACTYACVILSDDGIPITADKIAAIVKAAKVPVESYWPRLFANLAEKINIEDLIVNVGAGAGYGDIAGSGGAASASAASLPEEKTEERDDMAEEPMEESESSDDDMVCTACCLMRSSFSV